MSKPFSTFAVQIVTMDKHKKHMTEVFFNGERVLVDDLGQGDSIKIPFWTTDYSYSVIDFEYLLELFKGISNYLTIRVEITQKSVDYYITRDVKQVRKDKIKDIFGKNTLFFNNI